MWNRSYSHWTVMIALSWVMIALSLSGCDGEDGAPGPMGPQGDPGINWTGPYSNATTYQPGDGVAYEGSSYICIRVNTGQLPTNTTYWDLIAEDGDDGEDGQQGPTGPTGPMYWQGEYQEEIGYSIGDAVSYQGSAFICTNETQGNLPTNHDYWDVVAMAGQTSVWAGGDVTGMANFLAGADFLSGTDVDFTGVNVSGLEAWNGGMVAGRTTFLEATAFQDTIYSNSALSIADNLIIENPGGSIRWLDSSGWASVKFNADLLRFYVPNTQNQQKTVEIGSGEIGTVDVYGPMTNSEVHIVATNAGEARVQLSSDSVARAVNLEADEEQGGCGVIELRNNSGTVTIEFNGCTGKLISRDSLGRVTIELDPSTGNIYYTGSLVKR